MKTEQIIKISDIKYFLPPDAAVTFQRKKGQTGKFYLEIEVRIVPNVSQKEHQIMVDRIVEFLGEDLIEVYTETEGYHFFVYIRMSSTQPTTVIP